MFKALNLEDALIYHTEEAAESAADLLNATEDEEGVFYKAVSIFGPFSVKAVDSRGNFLFYVGA